MITNESKLIELKQRFVDSFVQKNESDLTNWEELNNPDILKFFQQVFTEGLCVNFQLAALEHLQDWKEYLIFFGEDEYNFREHSVLKHPTKDLFFDAYGVRSLSDILATYNAQNEPYIWHDEADTLSMYEVDDNVMSDIAQFFIDMFKVNDCSLAEAS